MTSRSLRIAARISALFILCASVTALSAAETTTATGNFSFDVTLFALPEAGGESDGTVVVPKEALAALKKDGATILLEKTIPGDELRTEALKGSVSGKAGGQAVKVDYDLQFTPRFLTGGDVEFNVNARLTRSVDGDMVRMRTVRALGEAPHLKAMEIRAVGLVLLLTPHWK